MTLGFLALRSAFVSKFTALRNGAVWGFCRSGQMAHSRQTPSRGLKKRQASGSGRKPVFELVPATAKVLPSFEVKLKNN
jgi:hypothetical protein